MATARSEDAWNHTANVLSLLANCNRDPRRRRRPFSPLEFHPHHRKQTSGIPITADNIGMLKGLVKRKG